MNENEETVGFESRDKFLDHLQSIFGIEQIEGTCRGMNCNSTALNKTDFVDDISWDEFQVSGLCQKCQDLYFKEDDEDEE